MKALLRIGTASALVMTTALAGGAFAQDAQSAAPATTTAPATAPTPAATPATDTKTTTTSSTTTEPATTEAAAPMTKTTTKTKSKTKAKTTSAAPTSTDAAAPAADAAPAAAAMPEPAPAATPTAAAAAAAPATDAPATAAPATPATAPAAAATAPAAATAAPANPTVGGAAMEASKTIVDNASAAPNLTTLVSAVKAADLAATLAGTGPFTVFAPTNDAFGRLAPGTVDTLMKPANKASLARVLKYHVVAGTLTIADLKAKVAAGGGTASLTTVEGQALTVKVNKTAAGDALELTDANGNKSYIETGDVRQSNGIVHVVNGVVIPKLT